MGESRRFAVWIQLALLLIVSILVRLPHIRADVPRLLADMSGSAGEYFDEGIYGHNARNKILFDRWIMDEWNPLVYNAPLTGIYYCVFHLFGVSIVSVKGLNIFFGCMGVLLLYLILDRFLSHQVSWALSLLFSLEYYWLMYNRLGLLENFSALAFLLVFYLFSLSLEWEWIYILTGMVAAITVLTKYLFAFCFLAALLAVVHRCWQQKKMKPVVLFIAGFGAIFLAWLALIYLPFSRSFAKIGASWGMLALPRGWSHIATNLRHQAWFRYLALLPLIGFAQVLFFSSFLARALGRRLRQIDSREVFLFFWLLGGIMTMGSLQYAPLRYYLPLVPALFLAVAFWLHHHASALNHGVLFWLLFIFFSLIYWPVFRHLLVQPSAFFVFPPLLRGLAYSGMLALILLQVWPQRIPLAKISWFLFSVAILLSSFLYWRYFFSRPTYNLETAATYIRNLPANSVLMGQEALRLGLDTGFPLLEAYKGWFNDENPFAIYRPTHLLVLNKFGGSEYTWIQQRFPQVVAGLQLVRNFWVWDTTISLYRVNTGVR